MAGELEQLKKQNNKSEMVELLVSSEKKIMIYIPRLPEARESIKMFLTDVSTYLKKISIPHIKKYVQNVVDKNLIFLGHSLNKNDVVFSRVAFHEEKLSGIIIDAADFNVDMSSGQCDKIDDVIFAIYFSLIRAGVIIFQKEIYSDYPIHKIASTFLFGSLLKSFGRGTIYSEKQKELMNYVLLVLFYKHFFMEKLETIHSKLIKNYSENINLENVLREFGKEKIKVIDSYSQLKEIPRVLNALSLINEDPNVVLHKLMSNLGIYGYCSLYSLDYLIAMIVICQYPFSFFPKTASFNPTLSAALEKIMFKYLDRIQYAPGVLLQKYFIKKED